MKLILQLVMILVMHKPALSGLRDPFLRSDGKHSYAYTAFGYLHGTDLQFGMLSIDGVCYRVKSGDVVTGHEIVYLSATSIDLKDSTGKAIKVFLQ